MRYAFRWNAGFLCLVLAACSTSPKAGSLLAGEATTTVVVRDGVEYLRTEVTVTNVDSRPVPLKWQGCRLHLELYSVATRVGTPAWRSAAVDSCSTAQFAQNVQPGTTYIPNPVVYERRVSAILGDSLPDGEYFFLAVMPFTNRAALEIPAGSAGLQR
jgi:hypothetical protein